jgi:biotin carboxyl carrier protein
MQVSDLHQRIMKLNFNDQTLELTLMGKSYRANMGDKTVDVEILRVDTGHGKLDLLIDGERVTAYISSDNTKRWVTVNGRTYLLTKQSGSRKSGGGHHHAAGELTAPMPGQVRAVNVREGDAVTKGQTLLLLEAMKMEIRIQAPSDGVVSSISVTVGQTVEREQTLIMVESQKSNV